MAIGQHDSVIACVSDNVKPDPIAVVVDSRHRQRRLSSFGDDRRLSSTFILGGQAFWQRLLKLRFQLCLFLFFSMFCMMFVNLSLGVTLLCMTQPSTSNDSCFTATLNDSGTYDGTFVLNWSLQKQWLVLSAMSWGRLLSPAAGLLVDKVDNGRLLEASFVTAGLASTLVPYVSFKSFPMVIALRVIVGMADAVIQPCTNRFIAQWYTDKTRTNAFGWATAGRQLGALVVYPVSGILCTHIELLGGWPMVFYLSGVCCCLWTLLFHIFKVVRLRKRQKSMLQNADVSDSGDKRTNKKSVATVPWKSVLSSSALWANIGAILCHEIPLNLLFTFLPRYIRDVMKVGIQFNSLLSTLPVSCFLVSKIAASQLDHVVKCKFVNFSHTRLSKIFNASACTGLAAFLLCASFLDNDRIVLAMVCLCLSAASAGLHTPGCLSTLVSMAPGFTGSLSGFTYFFISISSILNPLVVGTIVVNERASEWSVVFQGASVVAILPVLFFTLWGSAEEQSWGGRSAAVMTTQSRATICSVESTDTISTIAANDKA